MQWFQHLIDGLLAWSNSVLVGLFTFVGAFLEEVIAPIPSPLVMTTAGSIAKAAGHPWIFLLWLTLLGAVSKTLGSWIVYAIADKGEDFLLHYFGKFLGITSEDIRELEKKLRGKMRQDVSLFVLRSLPIVSSSLLSILCGVLKIDIRLYLVTTFLGTLVRNMFFLVLGYVGVEAYQSLIGGVDTMETITKILMVLGVGGVIGWMYWRRWSKKNDQ